MEQIFHETNYLFSSAILAIGTAQTLRHGAEQLPELALEFIQYLGR